MKDYKNIDRLFQEKFRDFEQKPSPQVWDNISGALTGKPKKDDRRVFWLWFSGVAAGLTILFSINNPFITTSTIKQDTSDTNDINNNIISNPQTEITNTSTKEFNTINKTNTNPKTSVLTKTTSQENNKKAENNQLKTTNTYIASENILNEKNTVLKPNKSQINKFSEVQNKEIAKQSFEPITKPLDNNPLQANESSLAENSNSKNIIKQSLNAINNDTKSEELVSKNKSNKKWILSTIAAPIVMSSFDKGISSIDTQFNENSKQGQISASYGVQLAYQISDRFMVQSGLHKVTYGYKTNDVFVSPDRFAAVYSNINYDDDINLIEINPIPSSDSDTTSEETRLTESEGSLTQIFGYYEIPLEAKYAIKKGDFGVNVLGGFSTLILNKNEIYVQTDEFSNKIGEASNLNSLNLTGNLGIELDYKILQNVHFNVTPMIKVHANTFEKNTNGFSPYAIGVYSGLNFRF